MPDSLKIRRECIESQIGWVQKSDVSSFVPSLLSR